MPAKARRASRPTTPSRSPRTSSPPWSGGTPYEGLFHYDDVEPGSETKQVAEGTENLVYQAAEGEKWVDVNLTDNSVTAYVGGKVAGGPFYMVPGAPETPTIVGTFHVYLKYDVQTMRGENADGTKYETEGRPVGSPTSAAAMRCTAPPGVPPSAGADTAAPTVA